MTTVAEVLEKLQALANPDDVAGMARFGMSTGKRLGVRVPDMRRLAREIGKDHALSLALWPTGIPEARIVAALVGEPQKLTGAQMDAWVADFDSWDVCDQVCLNLFDKTPLAWEKVEEWSLRPEEFVKRAAFALIATLAWHDKKATDEQFIALLPLIKDGASDERNYVKKGVSWALRHIGKRNLALNRAAIATATELQALDSRSARWIANEALRELQSDKIQARLAP